MTCWLCYWWSSCLQCSRGSSKAHSIPGVVEGYAFLYIVGRDALNVLCSFLPSQLAAHICLLESQSSAMFLIHGLRFTCHLGFLFIWRGRFSCPTPLAERKASTLTGRGRNELVEFVCQMFLEIGVGWLGNVKKCGTYLLLLMIL